MAMALQKSTDGGVTFEQVSVSVEDYTLPTPVVANMFDTIKDSQNNTYILCKYAGGSGNNGKIIKISSSGIVSSSAINILNMGDGLAGTTFTMMMLNREEDLLLVQPIGIFRLYKIQVADIGVIPIAVVAFGIPEQSANFQFAIYQDRYIWVASGNTVKIYDYDSKAELASVSPNYNTTFGVCCHSDGVLYTAFKGNNGYNGIDKFVFNGIDTITRTQLLDNATSGLTWIGKQLLIDRFGDLIILTNTGTASTLLKYSNTGTLIQNLSLSVAGILGVGRGAYGLQVYSKDKGTKCWVQFSNDLGTWQTAETTAQGQVFGTVTKIRDNGVTVYGDDHGGDNNYSVRC